jgi:hypothetical protein
MITKSSNADIANRGLELDQRMSAVVWIGRASLATGAEVGIVADSALVSITLDICLNTVALAAKRTITIDTVVTSLAAVRSRQSDGIMEGLVDRDKSVTRVDEARVDNAICAEVPIWAIEALVTDTIDIFVAAITDSIVTGVAARSKQSLSNRLEVRVLNGRKECMLRVVAMLVVNVAWNAEIIIITSSASNEALLGKFLNAAVASTGYSLLGSNKGSL